jgi:flagellar protein FliJ
MSFRFRLQRVLELREQAEQARARSLAEATDRADDVRRAHEAMQSLRTLQREGAEAATREAASAGELQHFAYLLEQIDHRLQQTDGDLAEAERLVAEATGALQAASRDRRVLDRLKERHVERWQGEALHQDRNAMDEIALSRFTRARRPGERAAADHSDGPAPDTTSDNADHRTTPPASPALREPVS